MIDSFAVPAVAGRLALGQFGVVLSLRLNARATGPSAAVNLQPLPGNLNP